MAKIKWTTREWTVDDVPALQQLYLEVHNSKPPLAHFLWKFRDNPAGHGIIILAEDEGRIVGEYALMPTRLRLGDELVLGAISLDTMTHPDYRGQRVFVTLAEICMKLAVTKGVEALYGFPDPTSYPGFVRRLNWDHTGDIARWVRILRSQGLTTLPTPVRRLVGVGLHTLPSGNATPKGIEIHYGPPPKEELELLLEEYRESLKGTCRVDRSPEWVQWRFDQASRRGYEWITGYRDGHLKAWSVFATHTWGGERLIDMMGLDSAALEATTSTAIKHARGLGVDRLFAFTNDPKSIRTMKSCGFIHSSKIPLIVRSMTPRNLNGNIHDHNSWRVSSADVDTF